MTTGRIMHSELTAPSQDLVVMSFHPVTSRFSEQIAKVLGPITLFYDAANLRKLSPIESLRSLRSIQTEKLVIAIEGDAGRALIGPLSIAAFFTRAKSILVIWPDFQVEQTGKVQAAEAIARAAYDTLSSRYALRRSGKSATKLKKIAMPRRVTPAKGSRVLYLDANLSMGTPVGGSIGHTAGVIEGLLRQGFEVDYASLKPIPTQQSGARWICLRPESLLAMPPELNFYRYAETIESVLEAQHRVRPWSFIYQRFSLHNFSGPQLGQKLDLPVVVEFNGSETWAAANWGTRLALHDVALKAESTAVERADLLVTISDELGQDLIRRGIPKERIVVYPNCVDSDTFRPDRFTPAELSELRGKHGIPADALVAGFIGTFGQWHGVDFLATCIKELVRDDHAWLKQNKIHFVLVGDGLKMPIVRKMLDCLPESEYVTMTGLIPQSEAAKYLSGMDILLSPHVPNTDGSAFFGSPTKIFEYMAIGKPIIAAALGQIKDVIAGEGATKFTAMPAGSNGSCGYLFEPGNVEEFRKALREVVSDMPAATLRAKAARAEVLNRYTWNRHVETILGGMKSNGLL